MQSDHCTKQLLNALLQVSNDFYKIKECSIQFHSDNRERPRTKKWRKICQQS